MMLGHQMPMATQIFQKSVVLGFCLANLKNDTHIPWRLSLPQIHRLKLKRKREREEFLYSRRGPRNQGTMPLPVGDIWKAVW